MCFLIWVGSKGKLCNRILPLISKGGKVYVEPFLGSGSVLIELLMKAGGSYERYICGDMNKYLIKTFKQVKENHIELIDKVKEYEGRYRELGEDDRKTYYLELRDRYNFIKDDREVEDVDVAALFIALNRMCYRGLYRVNSRGLFNTPYGHGDRLVFIDKEYVEMLHDLFNTYNVVFVDGGYDTLWEDVKELDDITVYLDPPYYKTFNGYTKTELEYNKFMRCVEDMKNNKGVSRVVLSNSIEFSKVLVDDLFDNVEEVSIDDRINLKGGKRREIVAYFDNLKVK